MHWPKLCPQTHVSGLRHAYERISGLCLQPHKRIHVLALNGIRVVTEYFGRKSKLKFGRNLSCSYVRPVETRGSTVCDISRQWVNFGFITNLYRLMACHGRVISILLRIAKFMGFSILRESELCDWSSVGVVSHNLNVRLCTAVNWTAIYHLQSLSQNCERLLSALWCQSDRPHTTARLPLQVFSWNFCILVFFENFKYN
jgi:hypothetical protein